MLSNTLSYIRAPWNTVMSARDTHTPSVSHQVGVALPAIKVCPDARLVCRGEKVPSRDMPPKKQATLEYVDVTLRLDPYLAKSSLCQSVLV